MEGITVGGVTHNCGAGSLLAHMLAGTHLQQSLDEEEQGSLVLLQHKGNQNTVTIVHKAPR